MTENKVINLAMTEEDIAHLAGWLCQHSSSLITHSFDRNGSHSAGEYREHVYLYNAEMVRLIKEWYDSLL